MITLRVALGPVLMSVCIVCLSREAVAQGDLLDKVRRTLRETGLEKSVKNLSVFSQQGGGTVSLSGRAANGEVKKAVLAAVRGVAGVKEIDAVRLDYPTFDVVIQSNLTTIEEHRKAYLEALHDGYVRAASGGKGVEYTRADGPLGDGTVPFRVGIDHASVVSFGDTITAASVTGNVISVNQTMFGAFPGSPVPPAGENLGPGYRFIYSLMVREKGTIKYTFQKWDGTLYKNLYSVAWPIATTRVEPISQSAITLGRPPAKAPPCPIDIKTAREIAVRTLLPPKPDVKALGSKCSASFVGSFDALVKRIVTTNPKERVPVELEIRNQSPWPLGRMSFYLLDPVYARKGGNGLNGGAQPYPPLLPGEKRKVTAHLAPTGTLYFAPFGSRTLSVVKVEPGFTLSSILE